MDQGFDQNEEVVPISIHLNAESVFFLCQKF